MNNSVVGHFIGKEETEMFLLREFNDGEFQLWQRKLYEIIKQQFYISGYDVCRLLDKTEEYIVYNENDEQYLIEESNHQYLKGIEIGEIFLMNNNGEVIPIEKFDYEYLVDYSKRLFEVDDDLRKTNIDVDTTPIKIIDKGFFEGQLKELKRIKEEEDNSNLTYEEEQKMENSKKLNEQIRYESGEEIEIDNHKITETCMDMGNEVFTFTDKRVNEVIGYYELKSNFNSVYRIQAKLTKDKINHIWKYGDKEFKFFWDSDGKLYLNDIKVKKEKLGFIMNRIRENSKNLDIAMLNRLAGIVCDFMNLKAIEYRDDFLNDDVTIPINVEIVDEKKRLFKLTCFETTKEVDWKFVNSYFLSGRRTSGHLYISKLMSFLGEFGFKEKKDMFNYLKKVRTMALLKKGREE